MGSSLKNRQSKMFSSRLTGLLLTAKYTKENKYDENPNGPNAINTCSDKLSYLLHLGYDLDIGFFDKEMAFAQFHGQLFIPEFVEDVLEMVQMGFCGLTVDKYII